MQCVPLIGLFLILRSLCATGSGQASPDRNEQEIRSVVAKYMAARNRNDPDAVRRLFTPDADQLVSNGEWRKGLTDVIRGTSASSRKEAGKSSIVVESVRFVDNDVAIVDGRYRTVSPSGAVRGMWTTIIFKRLRQDWRITAIRNMLPAPAR
ncbi:MAG: YybH family protein [Bryobacteraceae bacterium]|jgi:uncharacterized protein (TIGR02246 family)